MYETTEDKGALSWKNKHVQEGFNSVRQDLNYNLISCVATSDWPEVIERDRIVRLRDKHYIIDVGACNV